MNENTKPDWTPPLRASCVYTSNTEPEGYAGIFDATDREVAQCTMYGTALAVAAAVNSAPTLAAEVAVLRALIRRAVQNEVVRRQMGEFWADDVSKALNRTALAERGGE